MKLDEKELKELQDILKVTPKVGAIVTVPAPS